MTTVGEWMWAAGLFEGEGSVGVNNTKTASGKQYLGPYLSLGMKDADVLEHFMDIVGAGFLRKHGGAIGMQQWGTGKWSEVQRIVAELYPYLGRRRRAQCDRMLATVRAYKALPPGERGQTFDRRDWIVYSGRSYEA